MKKFISVTLILVIVLLCAGVTACATKPQPYWNDIPVYPKAKEVQKGSWSIPEVEKKWGNVKWSYWETNDSVDDVSDFYEDQMRIAGWKAEGWISTSIAAYGNFTKNDGKDGAMVWTSIVVGDKTGIALAHMQGSQ